MPILTSVASLSNPAAADTLNSGTAALKHATQHSTANDEIEKIEGFLLNSGIPACRAYNNANIAISNATTTALTFNSERFDSDTMHSTSSLTGRITFTTAGVYWLAATVVWQSNSTGYRWVAIRINGTTTYVGGDLRNAVSGTTTEQNPSCIYAFTAGQYAEVVVYQTSTGSLNVENTVSATTLAPEFMAVRVGGTV